MYLYLTKCRLVCCHFIAVADTHSDDEEDDWTFRPVEQSITDQESAVDNKLPETETEFGNEQSFTEEADNSDDNDSDFGQFPDIPESAMSPETVSNASYDGDAEFGQFPEPSDITSRSTHELPEGDHDSNFRQFSSETCERFSDDDDFGKFSDDDSFTGFGAENSATDEDKDFQAFGDNVKFDAPVTQPDFNQVKDILRSVQHV